jgi:hypothetical protein
MVLRSSIDGIDITIDGLQHTSNAVMKAAFLGVVDALQEVFKDSNEIISATDHTLKDLAKMGHPYGFKHPQEIHDPDVIVHIQSGRYEKALKVQKPSSYADRSIIEGKVGIMGDEAMETLDQRLQLGTAKMRARPWEQYLVDHKGEHYAEIVADRISSQLAQEES